METEQPNIPKSANQTSTVQFSETPQRVPLIRNILGVLTASLGGYAAYILVLVIFRDLGAIFTAPAAAALVGIFALWRINKDTILHAVTTALLTVWFVYNLTPFGLVDRAVVYVLIVLAVTAAYFLHRFILGLISRRYGLVFIVIAILLGVTYMYAGMGLRFHEGKSKRQQNLQEIDFQFYKPSYVPAGYVLAEPYAAVDFTDQKYVQTNLDRSGGGAIFINQFKTLAAYKPPVNCGPKSPVIISSSSPPVPCKELSKSKVGCIVYREITHRPVGFSGSEEKLILSNAYCDLSGTTIVIEAYDYELSNEEVVKIFDSMTVSGGQPSSSMAPTKQEIPEIKEFITANPIEIDRVKSVSKFRSCIRPYENGLNASSEPETNRSLSHHYQLTDGTVVNLEFAAPFDGVVESISDVKDSGKTQVRLAANATPWRFVATLTALVQGMREGSVVSAGLTIGYINIEDDPALKLVKNVDGAAEQYDSIFSHLSSSVMDEYAEHGLTQNNVIISKAERDSNSCPSNKFPDWVDLKH